MTFKTDAMNNLGHCEGIFHHLYSFTSTICEYMQGHYQWGPVAVLLLIVSSYTRFISWGGRWWSIRSSLLSDWVPEGLAGNTPSQNWKMVLLGCLLSPPSEWWSYFKFLGGCEKSIRNLKTTWESCLTSKLSNESITGSSGNRKRVQVLRFIMNHLDLNMNQYSKNKNILYKLRIFLRKSCGSPLNMKNITS